MLLFACMDARRAVPQDVGGRSAHTTRCGVHPHCAELPSRRDLLLYATAHHSLRRPHHSYGLRADGDCPVLISDGALRVRQRWLRREELVVRLTNLVVICVRLRQQVRGLCLGGIDRVLRVVLRVLQAGLHHAHASACDHLKQLAH
ncbi:hypothetical protein ACN8ZM_06885 [Burkholderia aenigmatica]|uniref:hypothetical protein n=1 Tax=Burkholderia aenigmatica TaxID=2015348 RepID=UPI003B427C23